MHLGRASASLSCGLNELIIWYRNTGSATRHIFGVMVSRVVSVKRNQTDANETSHSFWLCAILTNTLTTICNETWTGNTGHTHGYASKRWFTADEEIDNSVYAYVFCTNIFRNICIYVTHKAVMSRIHIMICSEFFLQREVCRAFICEEKSFIFDIRKDRTCQTQCDLFIH